MGERGEYAHCVNPSPAPPPSHKHTCSLFNRHCCGRGEGFRRGFLISGLISLLPAVHSTTIGIATESSHSPQHWLLYDCMCVYGEGR